MNKGVLSGLVIPPAVTPGSELAYAEITTPPTGITSTTYVDLAGLAISPIIGLKPVILEIWIAGAINNTANDGVGVAPAEGATFLGVQIAQNPTGSVITAGQMISIRRRLTPSAGVHTYKVQWRAFNGGTATLAVDPIYPAFIRCTEG